MDSIDREEGTPQEGEHEEYNQADAVEDAKEARPTLLSLAKGVVSKWIRDRWKAQDDTWRKRAVQLRVNYLRYDGNTFAQVHPNDPTRLYERSLKQKTYPTINRIQRAVHRYVAQVTADEPVMEAVPKDSSDDARDAAEAASQAIEGEWIRARLNSKLRRVLHIAAILRSGFWHLEWDSFDGGSVAAQKFFDDPETNEPVLRYVDEDGDPVQSPAEAAQILEGNIRYEVMTPGNIRWWGGRYAHEADEVMVGKLVTLRKLYSHYPELKTAPLSDLVGAPNPESEAWLEDIRGETPELVLGDDEDADLSEATGETLTEVSEELDHKVFVIIYYKARDNQYDEGAEIVLAGKRVVSRGPLSYGVIPVVQFKCLDELADQLGRALVDILRDPQELLDFVNGQILRYLQMLRRRWFVPTNSMVKAADLKNPTASVIKFNPAGGQPIPEQQPDLPNSIVDWSNRFNQQFDDQSGMHETMQGKHVPGVSSGRHAEALRTGDETLLGLTRTQIEEALIHAGRVMLEMMKEEWSVERQVQYFGEGREYVQAAFAGTQFGETDTVRLKKGTLLMLTPAQKLETIYASAQMGILNEQDLRRLAPLVDTAGISVTEDPHYQKARRENRRFLAGPPEDLEAAYERFESEMESIEMVQGMIQNQMERTGDQQHAQQMSEALLERMEEAERDFAEVRDRHAWPMEEWEADPNIAVVHAIEHARALAHDRADNLPEFWTAMFKEHINKHQLEAGIIAPPQPEGGEPGAEGADPRQEQTRHVKDTPPASPGGFSPAGFPSAGVGQG